MTGRRVSQTAGCDQSRRENAARGLSLRYPVLSAGASSTAASEGPEPKLNVLFVLFCVWENFRIVLCILWQFANCVYG